MWTVEDLPFKGKVSKKKKQNTEGIWKTILLQAPSNTYVVCNNILFQIPSVFCFFFLFRDFALERRVLYRPH